MKLSTKATEHCNKLHLQHGSQTYGLRGHHVQPSLFLGVFK